MSRIAALPGCWGRLLPISNDGTAKECETTWSGRAMARRRRKTSPQSQRWLPSVGDHYFLILGNGKIELFPWNDTAFDHEAWHFGNCFQTQAQAAQVREKIKEVLLTFHQDHA